MAKFNISRWTAVLATILLFSNLAISQPVKDGSVTISTVNTVLNRYTRVTADIAAGSNTVTVVDITELNRDGITYLPAGYNISSSGFVSNVITTGDLIMIYQAQGAIIDSSNTMNYGSVLNYNGSGAYELAYVQSVSGNTITLTCNTELAYFADRYVQVIRVPQYNTLTINLAASVVPVPWGNPSFGGADPSALTRRRGGVLSIHATNIDNNGSLNANVAGFRGGTRENNTSGAGNNYYTDFRTGNSSLSAEKGESIAGYRDDYDNRFSGRYGRGSAANGGGGGNAHNAGGGGGANGGVLANWFRGAGVMNDFGGTCGNPGAWTTDPNYIANGNALTNSSGGGRGGHTYGSSNQDACILGPSYPAGFISPGVPAADVQNGAWGGDNRDAVGGLGGRPIVSSGVQAQLFFGGGGGAGDGNNDANNDGGDGGGIVFLLVGNNITGNGNIQANGQAGFNTLNGNNDAPGGGGGGGSVLIQTSTIANTITINAIGGKGGDQLAIGSESEGPGGGGGGGVISINATTDGSTKTVTGGQNGRTQSTAMTEFLSNGATSGNVGTITSIAVELSYSLCADLRLTKTVNTTTPNVGTDVTFTITAKNNGPANASSVVVNDPIPAGYSLVTATPSVGTWLSPNWTIDNLNFGDSATITILATVNSSGSYNNIATISGDQNDNLPINNTASALTTPNFPPVANGDNGLTLTEDGTNGTINILTNDTDPQGNPSAPTNGAGQFTVDLNTTSGGVQTTNTTPQGVWTYNSTTGEVTFDPANEFNGTATLIYQLCDPSSLCDTAVISFIVTPVNDPPVANDDNGSALTEDGPNGTVNVLTNDTDIDGNPTAPVNGVGQFTVDLDPGTAGIQTTFTDAQGVWTLNTTTGVVTFDPANNYNGTAVIPYTLCDPSGACDNANITFVVAPVNDPPVANDDNGPALTEDGPNGTVNVITNDTDADGNPTAPVNGIGQFTVDLDPGTAGVQTSFTDAQGVWTLNTATGVVTFDPANNYNGTAVIPYTLCDPSGACDNANITFVVTPVNDAPIANGDNGSTNEDTPITLPNILANNVDVDNTLSPTNIDLDPLTPGIQSTESTPEGNWSVNTATGQVTFTPSTNFNGTATNIYEICDGGSPNLCDTAVITINVTPINDAPLANADNGSTIQNTPVTLPNILSNDVDVDNTLSPTNIDLDPLTPGIQSTESTPEGTWSVNTATGEVTFTPDVSFSGTATNIYEICDGGTPNLCDTAVISIVVSPGTPPIALGDNGSTLTEDGANGTINVLTNDTDPQGNPSAPTNGAGQFTVDLNTTTAGVQTSNTTPQGVWTYNPTTGDVTFDPANDFNGTATLIYELCDPTSLCDTAVITFVATPINDAPVANDDNATTDEDTPTTIPVLTNDSDNDNPLQVPTVITNPTNGTVTVNADSTITYTPNANFNGADTFTYSICDGGTPNLCDTATVIITVNAVNDAPIANDDTNTTSEDTPVSGTVATNDTDVDGPSITITEVTAPSNGTIVLNTDGTYTYTPNTNFNGNDTMTYSYCDGGTPNLCDTAILVITINAINDAPVANDDNATTDEDTPTTIPVLTNDSDTDNPLQVPTVITNPTNGTVTVNVDSTITYTPNLNFNGADTFTYSICDGGTPNLCDTATVIITINAINDAPIANDDTNTTSEDTPVSGTVATNDTDVDGPAVTITEVTAPSNGTITLNTDGTYTYTPNTNFNGNDTMTYSYCDGGTPNLCDTAILVITINAINDAPVANDDNATTNEDTPTTIPVLTNDSDTDNPLQVPTVITNPTNGTVTVNVDSTITYTPNLNFNGADTFTYSICDGGTPNLCDTATVIITINAINDAPIANDDTNTTSEDTPVSGTVATNDTDVDGPAVTITEVTAPSNGTITLNTDGTYTYTPNTNFNGADTITYSYCDGGTPNLCDTAILVITVNAINDAPVANDDNATTDEDTPTTIPVLTNDSDNDNPLQVPTVITNPTNGTVTVNADSTITYTPNANFNGADTFTYSICDGGTPNLCDTATVIITVNAVNDAPIANDDTNTTSEDTPVSGTVATNDTDVDGPSITITEVTAPSNGTIVLNTDGTYTYTPNTNFNGNDTMTYSYCDGGTPNLCDTAILVITINAINDAPVANDDNATTDEDTPTTIPVLTNDSDTDNPLQVPTVITNPTNGTVTVNVDSTITYTPNLNFNGADTFTYSICDGGTPNLCDTATVIITINAINDAPIANDDTNTTSEDTPVSGTVATNDTDVDGPAVTITEVTAPSNGTIVLNTDGTYTYTPNTNFNGNDTMTYSYCDGGTPNLCDTAILVITINAINDAPVANDDNATTNEDTPVSGTVAANDSDVDGPSINITEVSGPSNGSIVLNTDGTYTYTPNLNFNGNDTTTYSYCDGGTPDLCDTAILVITVNPVNDAPIISQPPVVTDEDTPVNFCPTLSDVDAGDVLTLSNCGGPSNGTAVISANCVTYTPNPNYNGLDTICLIVCDNGTPVLCDTTLVPINVLSIDDAPIAENDINSTLINTPVTGDVSTNDYDLDGDPLVYNTTPLTAPQNGTVVLNANGNYTYTPNNGFVGVDEFQYIVCANDPKCDTAWVYINVTTVSLDNEAPIANNDVAQTFTNIPVSGNVLNNDYDVDGTTIIINATPVTNPTNGTVVLNADGSYTYIPDTDFVGTDEFTYSICDVDGLCDTATVFIDVLEDPNGSLNDAPFAQDDAYVTPVNVSESGDVSLNDVDPNGDPLTYGTSPVTTPANGTVVINADGTFTYTPNLSYIGPDQFTYSVCDNNGACDTATVYITVLPSQPVAVLDLNSTTPNTPVSGNVLTNDEDPNGLPLTVNTTPVSGPSNGTLVLNADGTYTYTPNNGFVGTDTFYYEVCNGFYCVTVPVIITLTSGNPLGNDAPIANDDQSTTLENVPVSGQVLNNDLDPDGDVLTTTQLTNSTNGTVVFNTNGTYTYTPNNGFVGNDEFTYSACDPSGLCDTATVYITVLPDGNGPANDAPFVQDDSYVTNEDTPISGNVSLNDSDPNGDVLVYNTTPLSGPANGTVVLNADGTFTYTPNLNYNGPDQFVYVACDNNGACDTATVYILVLPVNDAPVANNDVNTTPEETPVSGTVATNDTDVDGVSVNITLVNGPSNGTIVLNADGTYTYTPNSGFNGNDTITYSYCDGGVPELCDTAILVITVTPINDPPVAVDDFVSTPEDVAVVINVLSNDTDPENNIVPIPTIISGPSNGTAVVNNDGTITYTPDENFNGLDTVAYVICDSGTPVYCDTAIVVINVTPVADTPVLTPAPVITPEDVTVTACFPFVTDNNLDSVSAQITCGPDNGTIDTIYVENGTVCIVYTPNLNYNGPDEVCITLCDLSNGLCVTETIQIEVTPEVDPCYWLKGISPNGDGQNDAFYVNCNEDYPNSTMQVFNRWGDQVWDSEGHYVNNFEGKNGRGEILPDGTYYYIYEYKDGLGRKHAGFVQITR